MLSVKRILRDYEDAGSVNSLISLWGFVDDSAFLTKAGHVGIAYRLRGIDYEGLTHAQSAAIVHRLEAALRLLDEHWRVYEYVVKRNIPRLTATSCSQPVANEAIHRTLTVCGVDRRLFFLALILGAATFNLFYSFLAGLLMFLGLYGFALWATRRDPDMLRILLASSKTRRRYDPGKHQPFDVEVVSC